MHKETERKIQECYKHIERYLNDEEETKELHEMCKNCDGYCGAEHDYSDCMDKMCFKFYLCFEYLEWVAAFS